jgi:hypothetical protein
MAEIQTEGKKSFFTIESLKEKLSTLIAITTVLLAVCATLASFKAAGYGNRMVLAQSQASDQWAFYQAKSIKETAYQVQRDVLVLAMQQSGQPEIYKSKIAEYEKEAARYKQEKNEILKEAQMREQARDVAKAFNASFGQSMIFLQVGILLSSLASIHKSIHYWAMGAVGGSIGVVMFIYTLLQTM